MYCNHDLNVGDIVKVKGYAREMMIIALGGKDTLMDSSKKYNGFVTCKWQQDGEWMYKDFHVNELDFVKSSQGVNVEMKRGLLLFFFCLLFGPKTMGYDFGVDGILYNIISESDLTVEVTGSNHGSAPDYDYTGVVVIPSSVTFNDVTYSVIGIKEKAFDGCTDLTSVTIPHSVTNIGYDLFWYCTNLAEIVVEEGNATYDSRDNCNAIH